MDKTERLINWEENEQQDRNRNGIDDEIEPPIPDVRAGSAQLAERMRNDPNADPTLTGGDLDTNPVDAQFSGEESAGGSSPSPDQNEVDEIGSAVGIQYADDEPLKVGDKERERDEHRWELDPASSEDYAERARDEAEKR